MTADQYEQEYECSFQAALVGRQGLLQGQLSRLHGGNDLFKLAQRGYVLEGGRIALEDDAAALLKDPRVREAYLGETV